ncbi:hypothetical protein L211DRAFT_851375 [Terfezia boudieri ATCC MYA-4762]|uniref:Uncharacterized protein n=1 Tax=Terfezia boudieri ATCC MYA-4762 TaxID=1051890 RepID=A0A3N4LJ00_9PEZI|nr:hypothetical protein L211DRAFT_851375 [Terfezia boudieri ATCC MYA-4762]
MFASNTTSGYGSLAPLSQSLAEDVQITFDTDMMDEDEALAYEQQQQLQQQQQQQPQQNVDYPGLNADGVTIGFDAGGDMEMGMDTDTVQLVAEKVHLKGVDTMATGDIEAWARKWVGEEGGLLRVQWIDDSSSMFLPTPTYGLGNLIFPTAAHAQNALNLLTEPNPPMLGAVTQPTPAQQANLLLIRIARICDSHPNARLEVRIARVDDVKQKGARERSRFYLFNPEYDRGEEFEKRRRGRREQRRDNIDPSPNGDGDYQRRRFDHREHERRIAGSGDAAMYDDNMYDDEPISTSRPRPRRTRSRSRSRSHSATRLRYHSRQRSPQPRRRWRSRSRSRSPPPRRDRDKNIELFPETAKSEPKGLMGHYGEDRFYNPPVETVSRVADGLDMVGRIPTRAVKGIELFPEKASQKGISILGLASTSPPPSTVRVSGGKELFPEKLGSAAPAPSKRGGLASRITLPGNSASGVLGYHSDSGVGSDGTPVVNKGMGSTNAEDDLFAEKMVMGRRVGLGAVGGDLFNRIEAPERSASGVGGRRKGRRNKAADLFG